MTESELKEIEVRARFLGDSGTPKEQQIATDILKLLAYVKFLREAMGDELGL